jgi:hypothetical protein
MNVVTLILRVVTSKQTVLLSVTITVQLVVVWEPVAVMKVVRVVVGLVAAVTLVEIVVVRLVCPAVAAAQEEAHL